MDLLPDDVVLQVFRHVDVDDLFRCRLVCKRLGALALHPFVWRHQSFKAFNSDLRKKLCRVLRLAPCLDDLSFEMSSEGHHFPLYATTRCAVGRLNFRVPKAGGVHAALIVRNQEALGRLKDVHVGINNLPISDATMLLGTLASTSVLEKLCVSWDGMSGGLFTASLHTSVARPSLKYFRCQLSSESQPFIDLVLAGHAATLEEVLLSFQSDYYFISTSTGSLPACMPNLRELTCSLLPGLESLASSLTKVTLHVSPDMRPGVLGATELLRRAPKLREVALKYSPAARSPDDVGVTLVEALAWSGRSVVEVLDIDNDCENEMDGEEDDDGVEYLPQLQPLVRALPSLPALRYIELTVYVPPDELLLAITPETAPALRELRLYPMRWLPARCAHDWLHKDSVQTLLSLNPALKFVVNTTPYCLKNERCGSCAQGCHNTLWEWDWEYEIGEDEDAHRSEFKELMHIR
ncbi:uncharacterized protein LOC113212276 isoform X2 [Frankliniella occidentalis]|uniref:Uncharacterized protein LOC113212276 isoform X2 n=1 Tax=Frankliniella occidentalis TaxID=133901 RepID=A0A6J1T0W5_FRAOC|nr:uncharacterized protein LOC113212276 isoform X2 [Frankliniella occidentalis]